MLGDLEEGQFWISYAEFQNYFGSFGVSETVKSKDVKPYELSSVKLVKKT